jgi:ATP-binding cassette subfamily B protein RaxB
MTVFALPWARQMTPVLQAEAAECGLACLTMVAQFHGHRVNLAGLRQRFPTSMKGVTLAELMTVADHLALGPRPLRLDMEELGELRLPAILHWDLEHFVVLERVAGRRVSILDPAIGRRDLSLAEVSRHFTGVAMECQPTPGFARVEARVNVRLSDLWSRLTNYGPAATQVAGLSLLIQLTALALPYFMQLTIDGAITQGDAGLLSMLALGFGGLYVLNALLTGLRGWVVLTLGETLAAQLAGNVVHHLVRLPLAYFERRHVGDLMSRIGSIRPIQELLTQGIVNAVIDTMLALTTLIVMLLISPALAGVVVAATLIFFAISFAMFPRWRQRFEEQILAKASEETYLLETMRAMRAIKLHGSEGLREAGWRNRNNEVVNASYRAQMFTLRTGLAQHVLFGVELVLVVYLGANAVIGGAMTLGVLLAFVSYRSSFSDSAINVVQQLQQWRMIGLHLERLSDIVGETPEGIGAAPPRPEWQIPAEIRLEDVSFAYSPVERPILDRISFTIPAGGFVAIVGPSGAGKTTLMRLMLGLLTPTGGRILIDGVPLGPATLAAWRSRAGAVLQDDALLTGTLADNIAFFDPRPDQTRIEQCARFSRIHDDVAMMPMGYHSLIGDMGSALSSGQRQRLLLARAAYRQPDALFLDEGTANLDEVNEAAIGDAIRDMPVTRIVIAHRPALVERADTVLLVNAGKVQVIERARAAGPPPGSVTIDVPAADPADHAAHAGFGTAAPPSSPPATVATDASPPRATTQQRRALADAFRSILSEHEQRRTIV